MNRKKILITACLFVCWASCLCSQGLPTAKRSEDIGFSSERLNRVTKLFQAEIDKGAIPGAVLLVARNGKVVYLQALGFQDREKHIAMKPDAIFRIASMTKPIASVAIMMLAEEGKIDLLAPVFQYLPEFKDVKVGVEKVDPSTGKTVLSLENPRHPMTVQDLLRHTSGLVYGAFGNTLVHQAYKNANLFDPGQTLAEFVTKLSKLPLAHQPGLRLQCGSSRAQPATARPLSLGYAESLRRIRRGAVLQAAHRPQTRSGLFCRGAHRSAGHSAADSSHRPRLVNATITASIQYCERTASAVRW